MKPVHFKHANVIYAKDQPQYLPLPAHKGDDDPTGTVTSCWKLSWKERLQVLLTGRIFWSQLTFNQPLQPIRPSLDFTPGEYTTDSQRKADG